MASGETAKQEWQEVVTALRENRRELVVSNHKEFDPLVYKLTQLNFLDISKCPLLELTDDLSNLADLTKLSLQHNTITSVPLSLGRLTNLKFLDLSFNAIQALPHPVFDNLSLLETLILDSNKLSELPSLKGLVELHKLSFSNNELLSLPDSITCCTKLKYIEASGNKIRELSSEIPWSNLVNLQHFLLNNNQLKEVPLILTECKKLRDFQLKENPVKDARLKKLAAADRPGNALMNYLEKSAKERKQMKQTPTNPTENAVAHRNFQVTASNSHLTHNIIINRNVPTDDNVFRIEVLRPQEVKGSFRPRIFACVVSGISLSGEGVLHDFFRFQTKLHGGLGGQRKLATISTHNFAAVTLPLQYSLQSIDVIRLNPLNYTRSFTGRQFLSHLQTQAELERKQRKMTTYSGLMQYLLLISPFLGPRQDPINSNKAVDIQPLPVTTDSSGTTLSLHPITGCNKTRLTKETTEILIEVAGVNDTICKTIIRALIGWLVQYTLPGTGEEVSPKLVTITPLTVVNGETGDRFARFPTEADLNEPDFLNVKIN
ncbi:hypothetical protein Aperf_G00000079650 [Anoplocephala perfoliata]